MSNSLILDEQPLQVLPSLAKLLGIDHAIVLQQLHWLLRRTGNGKVLADGEKYIYNTYEQWLEYFPWIGIRTIQRVFSDLEERGLILSCQPEGILSRRKYYRISLGAMTKLTVEAAQFAIIDDAKLAPSRTGKIGTIQNMTNWQLPLSETSSEISYKEPKAAAKPRARNALHDALCAFENTPVDQVGRAAQKRIGVALSEIKASSPDVTPEEIVRRGENYKTLFTVTPTANGLASHWGKCHEAAPKRSFNGSVVAPVRLGQNLT